jgi:hypothetical protein
MEQIKKFSISQLLGGAFAEYHNSFILIVQEFDLDTLHIKALFPPYRTEVETLNVVVTKSTKLVNTREIGQGDEIRDRSLNRFFNLIKDMKSSPNMNEKPHGELLWDIISHYDGLSKYEMNKQTAMVKGMLNDLSKPEAQDAIEKLNLTSLVADIYQQNSQVEDLMLRRIDGEAEKESVKTTEQRKIVSTLYNELVLYINATAVLEPQEMVSNLIEKVNALIDGYRRMVANMRPGGAGNESIAKKEDEDINPDEDGTEEING